MHTAWNIEESDRNGSAGIEAQDIGNIVIVCPSVVESFLNYVRARLL